MTISTGTLQQREEWPGCWDEYVGQTQVKRQIQLAAKSARIRKAVMGHRLIHGGAGMGKTALAFLVANELGARMHIISGEVTEDTMRLTLSGVSRGDVIFFDEVHGLVNGGKKKSDFMLHFLESGVLMGPLGPERYPEVTFLGATTDVRLLGPPTGPFRSRFAGEIQLVPYTDGEAEQIGALMVNKMFKGIEPLPTSYNLGEVAAAASNTPRAIRGILENLRDLIVTGETGLAPWGWDVSEALEWRGVTADGLTFAAIKYLEVLLAQPNLTAGRDTIAQILHQESGIDDLERMLSDRNLIARTGRGRKLTQAGITRVKKLRD